MRSQPLRRCFLIAAGMLSISLHVGCAALPWRTKPTPTNTAYEEYVEQSVASIQYDADAEVTPPNTRLSRSPLSESDRVANAASDESCTDGCCH